MTIRQLELFTLVYERRNLTRAAELLYMTQSAVTQNLKRMEEELGTPLFLRSSRQLIPSPAGERFYRHAGRILAEYRKALAELGEGGERLDLCYYASPSTAIKDRVVASFWEIDPSLPINQIDCRIDELLDNDRWTPDTLYLLPGEFIHDSGIRTLEAAVVRHCVLLRQDHRLCEKDTVRPEDLAGETILLRSRLDDHFPHLRAALDQLREKGVPFQTSTAERARELAPRILSFGGVAILPEYLVAEVPCVTARPYADGIDIPVMFARKGTLTPRVTKLLTAYRKRAKG